MTPRPVDPGFAAVWASLPAAAILIDERNRIVAVNPQAELFLNASSKVLTGTPVLDRLAIDAPMDEGFARARAHRAALYVNDVDVTTGERPPVQCTIQVAPLGDSPGTLIVLVTPREIADRLGRAAGVQRAAKSAIGMAEMLAHEIKNPLAGITGAAQLLSMNLPPEDRELTDLIVEETRRIVKLLEQVEQFGNLRPPERRAVNIHDVLDRVRRSAALGFAAGMTVIEDYDPSLPPAHADPDQLSQVFINLIKNAAEAAGPKGGTIRLKTYFDIALKRRRTDPGAPGVPVPLTVEVIDDGPGIAPEILPALFEPFVSGKPNGTGLGLALVSKIVDDHGGWIGVESIPGRTVFRVSLPVAPRGLAQGEGD
jgi:two-component system nitrogen regulation sensor histidine kinase GlnL